METRPPWPRGRAGVRHRRSCSCVERSPFVWPATVNTGRKKKTRPSLPRSPSTPLRLHPQASGGGSGSLSPGGPAARSGGGAGGGSTGAGAPGAPVSGGPGHSVGEVRGLVDGIAKACNVSAITASTTRAVLPLNDDVLPQLTRWDGGLGCKRGAHPRIPQFFSLFGQGISPAAVPPTLGAR